jgi:hypothetical protein
MEKEERIKQLRMSEDMQANQEEQKEEAAEDPDRNRFVRQ